MNPDSPARSGSSDQTLLTRREAIRRAALLLGVAISPSLLAGALGAAPAGMQLSVPRLGAERLATLAAAADRILPRTDTPGARDAGVPAFVELMFAEYLTADERRRLADGLADLQKRATAAHGRAFAALAVAEQDALLKTLAAEAQDQARGFFQQLRELTVVGYFTSELVGKEVLHYDPVPGRWEADVPLAQVGNRLWTR